MFRIFHALSSDLIFEIINPLSLIFSAVISEQSCRPFLLTLSSGCSVSHLRNRDWSVQILGASAEC